MTKASRQRLARRLGRPPKDFNDDPDGAIAELAIAVEATHGISERAAIDLALALLEGEPLPPGKIPRGAKAGAVVGYQLPHLASFATRNRNVRRKLGLGQIRPEPEAVRAYSRLLHAIRRLRVRP